MKGRIARRGPAWIVVGDVGRNVSTGKRQQHFESFRTQREAEAKLGELLKEAQKGSYVKPTKLTVAEWLERWLADYAGPNVRATTLRGYRKYVERHIIPSVGGVRLADLRPDHVKRCHVDALERGVGKQTVLHLHRVLSKALNDAMTAGYIVRNVATIAKPPRLDPRPKVRFEPQEVRAFLEVARATPYFEVLLLDLFLGLRRSELLGLEWGDIAFDGRRVYVRRSLHMVPGQGIVIYPTKNKTSDRDIGMSETVSLLFRSIRDRCDAIQAMAGTSVQVDSFVFADPAGKPMSPNTLSMATRKIAVKAGLPHIHLHSLRHWAASLALANDASLQEVQEFLGHSTIRTTADVYGHLEDRAKIAQAARMERGVRTLLQIGS